MEGFKGYIDNGIIINNDGEATHQIKRVSKKKGESDFFMEKRPTSILLAKDKELWGQTRAVLDYLVGILNHDNYVIVSQKEIAQQLDIGPARVSTAIRKLIKKDIVIKGKPAGIYCSYMINPLYFWRTDKHKKEQLVETFYKLVEKK